MRLTNLDISENHRHVEMYLMRGDFNGQFARWVTEQSPYDVPIFLAAAVAFDQYVSKLLDGEEVKKFTYDELNAVITDEAFEKIPAVLALNVAKVRSGLEWESRYRNETTRMNPDFDFIDLGALARNMFYAIVRHHINWAET